MSLPWLEHHVLASERRPGGDSRSAHKSRSERPDDGPIKTRHKKDIELLGGLDELHAGIIHNHLFELDGGVLLGDFSGTFQEQSVHHLHDVGLVDAGHFFPACLHSVFESKLRNSQGLFSSDDFEALENSWVYLVFDS